MAETKRKVVVVVNKSWEFEPFYNALTNPKLRPTDLKLPDIVNPVPDDRYMSEPRAEINSLTNIKVVFRCVENMMDPDVNKSNSEEKMTHMPTILGMDGADLVISVSTAESTTEAQGGASSKGCSINGSVLFGGNFFMFDGKSYDPSSTSNLQIMEEFVAEKGQEFVYTLVNDEFSNRCLDKFLTAKNSPAVELMCHAYTSLTSIGIINIMDYTAYADGDKAAYEAFKASPYYSTGYTPVCIETTHGIVNMAVNSGENVVATPVVFVSPITDRYECFQRM